MYHNTQKRLNWNTHGKLKTSNPPLLTKYLCLISNLPNIRRIRLCVRQFTGPVHCHHWRRIVKNAQTIFQPCSIWHTSACPCDFPQASRWVFNYSNGTTAPVCSLNGHLDTHAVALAPWQLKQSAGNSVVPKPSSTPATSRGERGSQWDKVYSLSLLIIFYHFVF